MHNVFIWASRSRNNKSFSPFCSAWSRFVSLISPQCVSLDPDQSCQGTSRWGDYLVNADFLFWSPFDLRGVAWIGSHLQGGGADPKHSRILIFLFSKESSSVIWVEMRRLVFSIRMCISGLSRCGRRTYNWNLPWCSALTQPSLRATLPI